MPSLWSVVLTGVPADLDPQTAARRLAGLAKIKPSQAHRLLANAPIALKRDLPEPQARRWLEAIEKLGIGVRLEAAAEAVADAEAATAAAGQSGAAASEPVDAPPAKAPAAPQGRPARTAPPSRSGAPLLLASLCLVLTLALAGSAWTIHRLLSFQGEPPSLTLHQEDFSPFTAPSGFACTARIPRQIPWQITDLSYNRGSDAPAGTFRYRNAAGLDGDEELHVLAVTHGAGSARVGATDRPATLMLLSSAASRWELALTHDAHVDRVLVHPSVETVRIERLEAGRDEALRRHLLSTGKARSIAAIEVQRLGPDTRCISAYPEIQGAAERRSQVRSERIYQLLGYHETSYQTRAQALAGPAGDRGDFVASFEIPLPAGAPAVQTASAE